MKRRILLVVVVVLGATATMTSCKKDYQCKCQKTYTKNGGTVIVDDNVYTYKDSRVKAEKRCNDNEGQDSDLGGEFTRDCEIQ